MNRERAVGSRLDETTARDGVYVDAFFKNFLVFDEKTENFLKNASRRRRGRLRLRRFRL